MEANIYTSNAEIENGVMKQWPVHYVSREVYKAQLSYCRKREFFFYVVEGTGLRVGSSNFRNGSSKF